MPRRLCAEARIYEPYVVNHQDRYILLPLQRPGLRPQFVELYIRDIDYVQLLGEERIGCIHHPVALIIHEMRLRDVPQVHMREIGKKTFRDLAGGHLQGEESHTLGPVIITEHIAYERYAECRLSYRRTGSYDDIVLRLEASVRILVEDIEMGGHSIIGKASIHLLDDPVHNSGDDG